MMLYAEGPMVMRASLLAGSLASILVISGCSRGDSRPPGEISGTALPKIAVLIDGHRISNFRGSYDLGECGIDSPGKYRIEIRNEGSGALHLSGTTPISVSCEDPKEFKIDSPLEASLKAGESLGFALTFSPKDLHAKNATLFINSDDPAMPRFGVSLTGKGEPAGDKAFPVYANTYAPVWTGAQVAQIWNGYDFSDGGYKAVLSFSRWDLDGNELPDGIRLDEARTDPISPGAFSAAMIWNGSEYALAWSQGGEDERSICFLRVSASGIPLAPFAAIGDPEAKDLAGNLRILWTGVEYTLSWRRSDDNRVYLARFDSSGAQSAKAICITTLTGSAGDAICAGNYAIAWNGSGYGFAWQDYTDEALYFTGFDANGSELGEDQRVDAGDAYSSDPVLVWTGKEYGLLWIGRNTGKDAGEKLFYNTITAKGRVGKPIMLAKDKDYIGNPILAWDGKAFGLVWEQGKQGRYEGFFDRITPSRKAFIKPRSLLSYDWSRIVSLQWTGESYLVIWQKGEARAGNEKTYLRFLDRKGTMIANR